MKGLTKKERVKKLIKYFMEVIPDPETELLYKDPYQLIVAVILSAQCTDKRVNLITPAFFQRFPGAKELASADQQEVFDLIKSCSYPNNKAKHLLGMARVLHHDFKDDVPANVEKLQLLPGVGRKTANVVAAVIHNMPVMPVDTHVFRVAARIGLSSRAKNPLQTEKQLTRIVPAELIPKAHHWLILHGRYICQARRPKCNDCGIAEWCKHYESLQEKARMI